MTFTAPGDCSGLILRHHLRGHTAGIQRIAWAPDGLALASAATDSSVRLWDPLAGTQLVILPGTDGYAFDVAWSPNGRFLAATSSTGCVHIWDAGDYSLLQTLRGHSNLALTLAWSSDSETLASAGWDMRIILWQVATGSQRKVLEGHTGEVVSLAWSRDSKWIASGAGDKTIRFWDAESGELIRTLEGHDDRVLAVTFSPDGLLLATASGDKTTRFWEAATGRLMASIVTHTGAVTSVSFSYDGRLFASKARDHSVHLYSVGTFEQLEVLSEPSSGTFYPGIAFHPHDPTLATLGDVETAIRIWDLNQGLLDKSRFSALSRVYRNAKVVLVGEPTVGKTALGLVLSGQRYRPTDSTNARNVWTFELSELQIEEGDTETREILLWDLAGQPGYRLLHELNLDDIDLAVIVFDAHSPADTFAAVHYWATVIKKMNARREASRRGAPMFLVSGRNDVCPARLSEDMIKQLLSETGCRTYFKTSAKLGTGIPELQAAIRTAIDWRSVPTVTSTQALRSIMDFIVAERERGQTFLTQFNLISIYKGEKRLVVPADILRGQVETCIEQLARLSTVKQMSFGHFVLLRPELLDKYASAIFQVSQDAAGGDATIPEDKVAQMVVARLAAEDRLQDEEHEKLLVLCTVQRLLEHEIAFRQQTSEGSFLVFPSQLTKRTSQYDEPDRVSVVYQLEGPVHNIYATLTVRLSYSGVFRPLELWHEVALFQPQSGGKCGVQLMVKNDTHAELRAFFEGDVSAEIQRVFEQFIRSHVERQFPASILKEHRVIRCSGCGATIPLSMVEGRRARGYNELQCPVCETHVPLAIAGRVTQSTEATVEWLNATADENRLRAVERSVLKGKEETASYDVFLCYNREESPILVEIEKRLRTEGIYAWLDHHDVRPFAEWEPQLWEIISRVGVAAIFLGSSGVGVTQQREIDALLREVSQRTIRIGVVLLPGGPSAEEIPPALKRYHWVDIRSMSAKVMDDLVWAISGQRRWSRVNERELS